MARKQAISNRDWIGQSFVSLKAKKRYFVIGDFKVEPHSVDLKKEVDLEDIICHSLGKRVKDVESKDDTYLHWPEKLHQSMERGECFSFFYIMKLSGLDSTKTQATTQKCVRTIFLVNELI